jgi:hypothetical protein
MNTPRKTSPADATPRGFANGIRNPELKRAVEAIAPTLIYPAERLHGAVEGAEAVGLDQRATLGFDWPWLSRVVLLITDRRLLELSVRPTGRRLEGRVRTFPWSMVTTISVSGRRLHLTSRNGQSIEWEVRVPFSQSALGRLKTSAAPLGEPFGSRVCDRCGSNAFSGGRVCSSCNARVVDPREVASYGWTVPGAGLWMTRHPVLGMGRLILELIVVLVFGMVVLVSGSLAALGAAVLGAAIFLPLVKVESVLVARLVAARSGVGMKWSGRLWDRLRVPVAVSSAALLVAPLFFAGAAETRISADLDFVVSDRQWSRTPPGAQAANPKLRSVWSHSDGWTVTVTAEALEPFADFDDTRIRIENDKGEDDREAQIANFEAFTVVNPAPAEDLPESTTRLELHVFDRSGRDVHTLATEAPAAEISSRTAEIRDLLRHAIWREPRDVGFSGD